MPLKLEISWEKKSSEELKCYPVLLSPEEKKIKIP